MTVGWNAIQNRIIAEYPHDINTVEDAIKVPELVQAAFDSAGRIELLARHGLATVFTAVSENSLIGDGKQEKEVQV